MRTPRSGVRSHLDADERLPTHGRLVPTPARSTRCRRPVRPPTHRPAARRARQDARRPRSGRPGRPGRVARCRRPSGRPNRWTCRPAWSESQTLTELRRLAAAEPAADPDDRPRLLRHHHAVGDPPQRAGVAGLVHRVHALPAGDQPGPVGGAAQLPDHGRRPDRSADRRREPAGRGDGGRRGDDAGPAQHQDRDGVPARRRHAAADRRRGPHPGRRPRPGGRGRRRPAARRPRAGRRVRRAGPDPGSVRPAGRHRRARRHRRRGPTSRAPWWSPPATCWR